MAKIVKENRCISCGVCARVCPSTAIQMILDVVRGSYVPVIDSTNCTSCGLCKQVCFATNSHFSPVECSKVHNDFCSFLGTNVSCYFGHSKDHEMRFRATSGGVVTTILHFLFDRNYVDGAIVAGIESGTLPLAKSFIAKNKDDLNFAMGSKYCPVVLDEALKSLELGKRYVMVGLPCQIYAVKQLAKFNKQLADSIILYVGLFCGGTFSYHATKYILKKYGLLNKNIQRIEYRGGGWPGRMLLKTDSSTFTIPHLEYWALVSPWFYLDTCMTCINGLCPQADISCGDAWLPEFMSSDKKGTSVVVSRTEFGDMILNQVKKNDYVRLQQTDVNLILNSQTPMLNFKFLCLDKRLNTINFFKKKKFSEASINPFIFFKSPKSYFNEISLFIGRFLASKPNLWFLFDFYKTAFNLFPKLYQYFKKILAF